MGFGVFSNFRSKGGGANNFGRVTKEGRKISDASLGGGAKNSRPTIFSESLGKIRGTRKKSFAQIR